MKNNEENKSKYKICFRNINNSFIVNCDVCRNFPETDIFDPSLLELDCTRCIKYGGAASKKRVDTCHLSFMKHLGLKLDVNKEAIAMDDKEWTCRIIRCS